MKTEKYAALRIVSLFVCIAAIFSLFVPTAAAEEFGPIAGSSAILIEPSTGEILYENNAYEQISPASTTKVMTALLVIEAAKSGKISLDDQVHTTQAIIDGVMYDASKIAPQLVADETMTVREYLYCILLASDCVACDVLANYICGPVEDFVAMMNSRAAELGCKGTVFINTHGYPVDGHLSTAYDLALITAEAMKHDEFNEIFGTIKYQLPATNKNPARMLYNTNWMLWNPEKIESIYCKYYYEYTLGGKTGSSKMSGHCLTSAAEKNGMKLVCVITGCEIANPNQGEWWNESFTESARLYEWGFANYTHSSAVCKGSTQADINIKKSELESMGLVAAEDVSLTIPIGTEGLISTEIKVYEDTVKAPVSAGDVMGEMKVSYNGELVKTINLIASRDAALKKTVNPIIIILILLVIIIAGVMLYVVNNDNPKILKQYKPQSTYRNNGTPNRPQQSSSYRSNAPNRPQSYSRPPQQQYQQPQDNNSYQRSAYSRSREQYRD